MRNIYIKDFDILNQTLSAILKLVNSYKLEFNQTGLNIHCSNECTRCSVFTNCVYSDEEFSIAIESGDSLAKTLTLLKNEETKKNNTPSNNIEMSYDGTFIYIKSNHLKTKIITVKEEVIQNVVSKAVTTQLTPQAEFKTSSEAIKKVLNNSFLFKDVDSVRVYLNQHEDMLQNCVYAEVTNKTNRLSNNITTKLGDITLGKITSDLIIDFKRLSAFDLFKNDNIVVKIIDKPNLLVAELSLIKNDIFSKFTVYNSLRKS